MRFFSIKGLDIVSAFREGLNIALCENVTVKDYKLHDSGETGSSFFTYGATFRDIKNLTVNNFEAVDCWGFGMHIINCLKADVSNVTFSNLDKDDSAIGLTVTNSSNVHVRNYTSSTTGDSLEVTSTVSGYACRDNSKNRSGSWTWFFIELR